MHFVECQGYRLVKIQFGLVKKRFASVCRNILFLVVTLNQSVYLREKERVLHFIKNHVMYCKNTCDIFSLTCIFNEVKVHLLFECVPREQSMDHWQYNPLEMEFALPLLFAICLLSQVSC